MPENEEIKERLTTTFNERRKNEKMERLKINKEKQISKGESFSSFYNKAKRVAVKKVIASLFPECVVCGYAKSELLCNHHLKHEEKWFIVSGAHLVRHSFENIVKELKKCVVVCQNCHAEIHGGLLDDSSLKNNELDEEQAVAAMKEELKKILLQPPQDLKSCREIAQERALCYKKETRASG